MAVRINDQAECILLKQAYFICQSYRNVLDLVLNITAPHLTPPNKQNLLHLQLPVSKLD